MNSTFSVVIPTRNRPEHLRACLAALAAQRYPKDHFDVIVVDDCGTTPTAAVVETFNDELNVQLVTQRQSRGPAAARNAGALCSQRDYLAFTDDDCAPDRDWLSELAQCLTEFPGSAAGGLTVNALTDNIYATASQIQVDYIYQYYNHDRMDAQFLTSNNFAVPAEEFSTIGGFDETFPRAAAEDREFCDRWRHDGRRIIYLPVAIVRHSHHMNFRDFVRQHFNYGHGAYFHHRIRRQRRAAEPKPLSFYAKLMLAPRSISEGRFLLVILMVVSQFANAIGYYSAKLPGSNGEPRRRTDGLWKRTFTQN